MSRALPLWQLLYAKKLNHRLKDCVGPVIKDVFKFAVWHCLLLPVIFSAHGLRLKAIQQYKKVYSPG
jgi:hypothetical protein